MKEKTKINIGLTLLIVMGIIISLLSVNNIKQNREIEYQTKLIDGTTQLIKNNMELIKGNLELIEFNVNMIREGDLAVRCCRQPTDPDKFEECERFRKNEKM